MQVYQIDTESRIAAITEGLNNELNRISGLLEIFYCFKTRLTYGKDEFRIVLLFF